MKAGFLLIVGGGLVMLSCQTGTDCDLAATVHELQQATGAVSATLVNASAIAHDSWTARVTWEIETTLTWDH